MALKQNKDGMAAAIAAAAQTTSNGRAHHALPRGTIGAVRAGVAGIQDIDPDDILAWGPQDRFGIELTAVNSMFEVKELAESILRNGQQVPVLLRPSRDQDGKFEVIYGRRRIIACRSKGLKVKALIRTLDDDDALIAKGLENAARVDLSYYERARFAKAIEEQGFSKEQVMRALAISKNTLSQLNRTTRFVPDSIGDSIGSAPGSGRPKWDALADAFKDLPAFDMDAVKVLRALNSDVDSDGRLNALLQYASRSIPGPATHEVSSGVTMKTTGTTFTLSVRRAGEAAVFAKWLEENIEELVKRANDEAS